MRLASSFFSNWFCFLPCLNRSGRWAPFSMWPHLGDSSFPRFFSGYELEERPPKEEKEEDDGATKKKYVTDDDVFLLWPDGDWLPRNWRIGFRQKPGGLHKIYVPPKQDRVPKKRIQPFDCFMRKAWASILWAFSTLSSACSLSLFAPTCLGSLQPPCNQYSCPKSATWISNCWAWIAPELISAAATVEEAGFCYQKADVPEYLATGKKLVLFGTSKFAEERWGDGMTKKRKKSRKHERAGRQYKFAKADDYLEASRWPKQMTPKWNHRCFRRCRR